MSRPTFLHQCHEQLPYNDSDEPDGKHVDDRVKDGVVDRVVDVPVLVIVQPSGLDWKEPGVNTFLSPVNFY